MQKLKDRWGITSNFQLIMILIVFSVTGSCAVAFADPVMKLLDVTKDNTSSALYWPIRIFLIFPLYQILLVVFGFLFGQFEFFWNFEKKMLKRMGLGFLFASEESGSDNESK